VSDKRGREELRASIRAMRTQAGLRQEELARRLGKPQSFVSKIETGERSLDVLELLALCKACDLSPAVFIGQLEERLSSLAPRQHP
jgi:transcriptional regulator with XRE-family HTH domain